MSLSLGADYSTYVQPVITPQQAEGWARAGLRRFALAMDASDATFASGQALAGAGIALDAYRELAGPATYPAQVQGGIAGLDRLAAAAIFCRIYWLTAEDTSLDGSAPHRNARGRLVAQPREAVGLAALRQARPDILVPAFHAAVDAAGGLRVGVYTGAWYWPIYMGDTHDFADLLLWHAGYNGNAALEPVGYGGWTLPAAHQYASPVSVACSVGLDLDAWAEDGPAPPPGPQIPANVLAAIDALTTWRQTLG